MFKPNVSLSRRGLFRLLAVAALAVVGVVGLHAVATDSEAGQLLASELPAGTSLSTASREQVIVATRRAVRKSPRLAVSVVRMAIIAKKPKSRPATVIVPQGSSAAQPKPKKKRPIDEEEVDLCPPCDFVVELTREALLESPEQAAALIEAISELCPDCAGALGAMANGAGIGIGVGGANYDPAGPFGFGLGLGPGFPGSPGFVGSPPGGILSLPPTGPATTSVVNL